MVPFQIHTQHLLHPQDNTAIDNNWMLIMSILLKLDNTNYKNVSFYLIVALCTESKQITAIGERDEIKKIPICDFSLLHVTALIQFYFVFPFSLHPFVILVPSDSTRVGHVMSILLICRRYIEFTLMEKISSYYLTKEAGEC